MNFRPRRRDEPEINLIPFIDVLLVVLIFLMLSTTYSKFTELQLTLPVADVEQQRDRPRDQRHPRAQRRERAGKRGCGGEDAAHAHEDNPEGGVSQRKLTHTHRVGSATVERWYQSFIKRRVSELSGRNCPQVLGIDEHFFTRKRGYATTLVDLKNHKVFDVVLGRSEASLRSYLKRLPGKENVRVIVMDLSETYRRIAQQYFPNAIIVADRFHVVRLVNQHFLKLWQQYDPQGRKNRGLLSLMRRHHWKLTAMQKENLHQYLAQEPVLRALYFAKQQLNGFLVMKSLKRKRAQKMMPQFLALIEQFEQSPARALAATLKSWLEPIVRMWRFTKSNGITEGFHTKMEMLSRRAYGFRNFENYRMRVLAQCGWSGVINRV